MFPRVMAFCLYALRSLRIRGRIPESQLMKLYKKYSFDFKAYQCSPYKTYCHGGLESTADKILLGLNLVDDWRHNA